MPCSSELTTPMDPRPEEFSKASASRAVAHDTTTANRFHSLNLGAWIFSGCWILDLGSSARAYLIAFGRPAEFHYGYANPLVLTPVVDCVHPPHWASFHFRRRTKPAY